MTTTATALVRHFRVGFAHLTLASPVNSSGHPGGMDAPPKSCFSYIGEQSAPAAHGGAPSFRRSRRSRPAPRIPLGPLRPL